MRVVPVLRSIELPLEFFDLFFSASTTFENFHDLSCLCWFSLGHVNFKKKHAGQNRHNVTSAGSFRNKKPKMRAEPTKCRFCPHLFYAHIWWNEGWKTPLSHLAHAPYAPHAPLFVLPHTRHKFAAATTERWALSFARAAGWRWVRRGSPSPRTLFGKNFARPSSWKRNGADSTTAATPLEWFR